MKPRAQARLASKSSADTVMHWRALLGNITTRRRERLIELEENDVRRQELACDAAHGQDEALKAAAALAERAVSIQHELALLQIAEERSQSEMARLDREAATESRAVAIQKQRERLAGRSRLAARIEDRLKDLVVDLNELDRLSEEASTSYYALGGERLIIAPLARSAVGSRLSEFCFGLGMAQWLPVACSATKVPPTSFCQVEIEAQAAYQIPQ